MRPAGSRRVFRTLLRLFPADVRESHGREMEQVMREQHRDRQPGVSGALAFWTGVLSDVLRVSVRQHAEAVMQDVRYAVRGLRRAPAFATVALTTIALGTGATSGVFAVVNSVLIRPLPYDRPDDIALVWAVGPDGARTWLSAPELTDLAERSTSLQDVAGLTDLRLALTGSGAPEELDVVAASERLFPLLGTRAELGRLFERADDRPAAAPVVVLSHGLWVRRFGASPAVLGSGIVLDGRTYTVVGVLPRSFGIVPPSSVFPSRVDAWVPLEPHLSTRARDVRYMHAIARVRPDVAMSWARQEAATIGQAISKDFASAYRGRVWTFDLVRMQDDVVRGVRPALLVLLATVCLVLLIASANVGTLLLVRGESRRREMAIRTALGASGSRVIRQLLTEGLVLAFIGGAAGLALAALVPSIARVPTLASLPRFAGTTMDWRVVGFAAGISSLTAVLFTLAPLLQRRSRRQISSATAAAPTRRSMVIGRVLATIEIALASMVLIAALMLGRSFARILDAEPGFDTHARMSARVALPPKYSTAAGVMRFFDRAIERVSQIAGVEAAAAVTQLPLSGAVLGSTFTSGIEAAGEPARIDVDLRGVTPEYFAVMGIRLVAGRALTPVDSASSPRVAVIDEAMARRLADAGPVVGRRIRWIRQPDADIEVVGVVASVRHRSLDEEPRPTVYRPHTQYARSTMYVIAQGSTGAVLSSAAFTTAIQAVDPDQPVSDVSTMDALVKRSIARPGFGAAGGGVLALLALTLAAVGTYGLLAFVVAQRTREVGVRMALGARRREITWMILSGGARLAIVGVLLGVAGGVVLGRWISATVPGVVPLDASVVVAAAATVIASALLACWIPARRAALVDPSVVLRRDA